MTDSTALAGNATTKLNTKDLINVGVFSAIYFVLLFALGMIGLFGPLAMFIGHGLGILANGVVVALLIARVKKFGAFTLLGLLVSFITFVLGHPWYSLLAVLFAAAGDYIAHTGGFRSAMRNAIGYAVYSISLVMPMLPIYFDTAGYHQYIANSMSEEYATQFMDFVTAPTLTTWIFVIFFLAIVGGLVGHRVVEKHFKRAGLTR